MSIDSDFPGSRENPYSPVAKRILIVGGSRGIGPSLATRWLAQGEMVATWSRATGDFVSGSPVRHLTVDVFVQRTLQEALRRLTSVASVHAMILLEQAGREIFRH